MLLLTLLLYLLSTLYWAYSVAEVADRLRSFIDLPFNTLNTIPIPEQDAVTEWLPLANAFILMNSVISDGVVVWRARVICLPRLRKYLWPAIIFFLLAALVVWLTIGFRIAAFVKSPIASLPSDNFLARGIDVLQTTALSLSIVSNLSATAVVGATAWQHRRIFRAAFTVAEGEKTATKKADQVLSLVVETGVVYSLSTITLLVTSLIQLPYGNLGDLYGPIHVQIAGAYPSTVLLLNTNRSLNESSFSDSETSSVTLSYSSSDGLGPSRTQSITSGPGYFPWIRALGATRTQPKIEPQRVHGRTISGPFKFPPPPAPPPAPSRAPTPAPAFTLGDLQKHRRARSHTRTLSQASDGPTISGPEIFPPSRAATPIQSNTLFPLRASTSSPPPARSMSTANQKHKRAKSQPRQAGSDSEKRPGRGRAYTIGGSKVAAPSAFVEGIRVNSSRFSDDSFV
ncbi:hypothetical protein GGX14DRAFT_597355 [Mycena pura]|uniref:Uncharacterized protein n=1 Tax=Mycena pura TaxID=153505 RepID=A0AAD6VMN0_9AGAR|nr:hypothetical protein GGX14DRAFT_597355 [Mycena pura]